MISTDIKTDTEKRIAKLRPKISKQEAARLRQESMQKFKRFDFVSFVILTIALLVIQTQFYEAAKPEADSEALFNTLLLYGATLMVYIAIVIRTIFVRYSDDRLISEDKTDYLTKGTKWAYFSPLIAMIVLLPALFAGLFNDDSTSTGSSFGLLVLVIGLAVLFAPLVAAFVITPIDLIIKGTTALVTGDKSRRFYALIGLIFAGITGLMIVLIFAVEAGAPYPVGSVQVGAALLGLPADYVIKSVPLLWVARAIVVFYIWLFIYTQSSTKRAKSSKK